MKFTNRKRRVSTAIAVAAVLTLGAGLAYAYWTSTGTGDGEANTGTSTAFVVESSPPTGGPLTPGGAAQSVAFSVTNPGTGSQDLANVEVTVANADGSEWIAVDGCSSLDYTLGTPVITYGQIAPGGVASGTVSITMNNLGTSQDACKTVDVPLYFVAS